MPSNKVHIFTDSLLNLQIVKIVMQKRICTVLEMEVIIMEIVSFVNERPLGETNSNDEDIPLSLIHI